MVIKTKKVIGKNSQQVLFLQGLLQNIKEGKPQQNVTFKINVVDKLGIHFNFEIYPYCKDCLVYRYVYLGSESLWQSWEDEQEIVNTFKSMGLL